MKKIRKFISSPKVSIAVFGAAIALLLASSIGGASAALTEWSENHETQIETQHIGVELLENGGEVPAEGLMKSLQFSEDGKTKAPVKPGKKYTETLSVQNTGEIDQYVRVTIYKYWVREDGVDEEGETKYAKDTTLNPGYINLNLLLGENSVWVEDESARTMERTVLYCRNPLKAGADGEEGKIELFADALTIDEQTKKVVTKVTDPKTNKTTVKCDYEGAEFRVEVEVDAVQTHNAADAIQSAWGCAVTGGEPYNEAEGYNELTKMKFDFENRANNG